jgi:DNA invertase Pin-like site-specific DNA recombinase
MWGSNPAYNRPALARALAALDAGDVLCWSHRLARSTLDLLNVLDMVSKRRAGLRSLGDAWADRLPRMGG